MTPPSVSQPSGRRQVLRPDFQRLTQTCVVAVVTRFRATWCLSDGVIAAHRRLQQAGESADGFSAAVTVVVNLALRRRLGRRLMAAAEAGGGGRSATFLDRRPQPPTRRRLRRVRERTLLRPALATLGRASVEKLEALIASKASASAATGLRERRAAGLHVMRKRCSKGCVALDAAELRDGVRAELSARRARRRRRRRRRRGRSACRWR